MRAKRVQRAQAGFSMIEMLMTAFVLAVGILGLTLLQAMAMKASRGSRSMSSAVLVAEQVMDQAEMEARLSWLNISDPTSTTPALTDLPNLKYVVIADGATLVENFNSYGGAVDSTSTDPVVTRPFYQVTTRRVPTVDATVGTISDFRVDVVFTDTVDATNTPIQRTVTLSRRILHG